MVDDKTLKWTIIRFIGAFACVVTLVVVVVVREGNYSRKLHSALVENCEKNGNPLREVLQKRVEREIEQSENKAFIKKLFPSLTDEERDQFVKSVNKEREKEKEEVSPINCEKAYNK